MKKRQTGGPRALLRALAAWMAAALFGLIAASLILSGTNLSSAVLGPVSSAISFLAAFAAGRAAAGKGKRLAFAVSLLVALFLVIILLSLGYLIRRGDLDPSGVLSVVSFTFAGVLAGGLIGPPARSRLPARFRARRSSRIS